MPISTRPIFKNEISVFDGGLRKKFTPDELETAKEEIYV
jgi:hypothetical protein